MAPGTTRSGRTRSARSGRNAPARRGWARRTPRNPCRRRGRRPGGRGRRGFVGSVMGGAFPVVARAPGGDAQRTNARARPPALRARRGFRTRRGRHRMVADLEVHMRPQREPMSGLPDASRSTRSGPRDGLQNEKTRRAGRGQGGVRPPARGGRAGHRRDDAFRPPDVGAAARRRRGAARPARPRGRGPRRPVLVPNEQGLERALARGVADGRDLRQRHRDVRPQEPQPQRRRVDRDVRAGGRAAPGRAGVWVRGLRLDVLR